MPTRRLVTARWVTFFLVSLFPISVCLAVPVAVAAASGGDREPDPFPSVAQPRHQSMEEATAGRGFIPPDFDLPALDAPLPVGPLVLPSRFDWRESGKVTRVKNQGACGSCYAFAAAANFESKLLVEGAGLFDFSENNVKECEWYGSSCSGGNYWRVANFLSGAGTVLETCDPYVASDVACAGGCDYVKTLLDWREFSHDTPADVSTIKAYLQTYGPIYTSMNAGHADTWASEFNAYNGSFTLYYTGAGGVNHAVLIVGWDDNLTHAGGQGAWIVKNSWGTAWGGACGYGTERGYFTIAYGSAQIGAWSSFIYDWQDADPAGSLLRYDEAGYTNTVGYGVTTAWGLCKFVPGENVIARRVEFWTADATTDVDVYIYDTLSGSALSGLLASKLNNSFDLPGYHSVVLASGLHIASGNDVYVVVKITDAAYKYPLVFDSASPRATGVSYISSNGVSWAEWTQGDLGVRLRVSGEVSCGTAVPEPLLTSISDVPGDQGGEVRLTWTRSSYDDADASPEVRRYKVWRRVDEDTTGLLGASGGGSVPASGGAREHGEAGAVWELVGVVPATVYCSYELDAPTICDGPGCLRRFYVSAHTGRVGEHFDSAADSGYSVDNSLPEGGGGPGWPGQPDSLNGLVTGLLPPEPNPGAGDFRIGFTLDKAGRIELQVYDVTGRRVAVLVDDRLDAGRHSVGWDATTDGGASAAPGLYFVRLITPRSAHTAKLVLAR
jgi:C1A family cysteine protease